MRIKITAVPSWFGKYAPVLRHLIGKDVPVADEPTTDRGVPVLAAEIARLLYDSEAALTAWRGWKINQPGRILYVPHDCCELIHEPENVDRE